MTFICTIEDTIEIAIVRGPNEVICRAAVGYELETGFVTSVFVGLTPVPGDAQSYELVFSVLHADTVGLDYNEYWDGSQTLTLISDRSVRAKMMNVTCNAVQAVVDVARPSKITFMTHHEHLPHKALRKYLKVCDVLIEMGYRAGQSDPYNGRRVWMAELI